MSGGGGKTQTITEKSNPTPWQPVQAPLTRMIGNVEDLYSSAPTAVPRTYGLSMTGPQRSALQDIESLTGVGYGQLESARAGLGRAQEVISDMRSRTSNPYEANFRQMAQEERSPQYANMAGLADQGRALADTYAGKYLSPDTNPYLKQYFDQAAADIGRAYRNEAVPGLMSTFRSPDSSMYALYQGEANRGFADSLQRAATGIYGQAYEAERQRQMAAAQQLASTYQGAEQMYANERARQAGLYGQAAGLYQQGFENLGSVAAREQMQAQLQNAQAQAEIQRRLQNVAAGDQLRAWQAQADLSQDPAYLAQLEYQQRLSNIADALGFYGQTAWGSEGTKSSTKPGNALSPLYGGMGGALAGGMAGSAASGALFGSSAGPYGAAAGAVLGGLLGAFGGR